MSPPEARNPYEKRLLQNVQQFGWHCTSVLGDTPFTYTVGLFATHGQPEVIVFGLESEVAHGLLSIVADDAAAGMPLAADARSERLVGEQRCVFVPVPPKRRDEYALSNGWYYKGSDYPLVQLVWPSRDGLYPWDRKADRRFRREQPVLGPDTKDEKHR